MTDSYRHRDDSDYQVIYTGPGSDLVITTGYTDLPIRSRPEAHRYATAPARASRPIIEFEDRPNYTRTKSTTTIAEITSNSTYDVGSQRVIDKTLTMSGALAATAQRTSSRVGTLYFAFGSDVSPSHFKWKAGLSRSSSSRPVALARLNSYQWIISSRGTPNIISLCEPGIYNNKGFLRTRERESDATVVYGLIYNLDFGDECRVDDKRGYREQGPCNTDNDLAELSRRPFLQGSNTVNKLYEGVEIVQWFTDPFNEGIDVAKDDVRVKCMLYVDESPKGYRPGRIWDDMIDTLSTSVTVAVRRYDLPRRWVENVMSQYEIFVLKDKDVRRRSRSRVKEVGFVEIDEKDTRAKSSVREVEADDETIIETRVTKKTTESFEPLPRSDFYREKRGNSTRVFSR